MTGDGRSGATTADEDDPDREPVPTSRLGHVRALGDELYVLVVAGVLTGALIVGVGSRLSMFALRLTSPEDVVGRQSDDGFTIGRFTLSGTYNLVLIGAAVGIIGAAAVQWVRPWLIGPRWFRLTTLAMGSGAVVGSMLVHADGIDFTVLEPMWFAVVLFVALPAIFAVAIALAVERIERRVADDPPRSWRRWLVPIALVAAFPPLVLEVAIATAVLLVWVQVRDATVVRHAATRPPVALVVRLAWLAVATLGLVALVRDIADLSVIS